MSLKNIELQVALPRTYDAGRLQEHLNQKSNIEQHQIGLMNQAQQELARARSPEVIQTSSPAINKEKQERALSQGKKKKNRNEIPLSSREAEHPYKGKYVDFTL